MNPTTPFDFIQDATRDHRLHHGCGAYTFEDGTGLMALLAKEKPRRVIELGTALGYTACCLASATDATQVDTIEGDPEHVALAHRYIAEAKLADRVAIHEGDFHQVMAGLDGPYDLAFFDGFAPDTRLVGALRARLRDGGLLVCANLGLSNGSDKRELQRDFADPTRWSEVATLERGGTQAYRKLA
jgi:predicted O-methyltransferase YrrM